MAGWCDHRENKSFDRHRPGHIEWPAIETGDPKMSAKVIVSYDGTANEDDAVALGRLFAEAGAEVSLAYVRHTPEPDSAPEDIAPHEALALLVLDSRPEAQEGVTGLSASAAHLIEIATCPVLVLPRGTRLQFGHAPAHA